MSSSIDKISSPGYFTSSDGSIHGDQNPGGNSLVSDGKPPLGDTSSHPLQSPQQTPHNAFPPAGSEQGRISTSDSGAGFSGASQDNDRGSSPVFSYTHSGGNLVEITVAVTALPQALSVIVPPPPQPAAYPTPPL